MAKSNFQFGNEMEGQNACGASRMDIKENHNSSSAAGSAIIQKQTTGNIPINTI